MTPTDLLSIVAQRDPNRSFIVTHKLHYTPSQSQSLSGIYLLSCLPGYDGTSCQILQSISLNDLCDRHHELFINHKPS